MRPEREPREVRRPLAEIEPEDEIEVGRYWRTIAARWWIVAAAVALGVLVGYLLSLGGETVYQARATVYLGQPLSAGGNVQIQSPATSPTTVSEIAKKHALADRFTVSTTTVSSATARPGQPQLVGISVRGDSRQETARAARTIATDVVERTSEYVDGKIATLERQLAGQARELRGVEGRLAALQSAVADGEGLSSVERLTLMNLIGFAEQRRGELVQARLQTRQLIALAQHVERSAVVAVSPAAEVTARSARTSMVVGGLIGLLAGIALALLWEPLLARRGPRAA